MSVDADQVSRMLDADCTAVLKLCGTEGATVSPAGSGVVAAAALEAPETLPVLSNARTVYEYVVEALSPVSVNIRALAPTCAT